MDTLHIETVGQLAATPLPRLEAAFGDKDAQWLFGLARGITGRVWVGGWVGVSRRVPLHANVLRPPHPCHLSAPADDAVEERKLPKSLNCGKSFRGRQALRDLDAVHKWLLELGE